MYFGLFVVLVEIFIITALNYAIPDTHISLDVLYCLPIVQAARVKALQAKRIAGDEFALLFPETNIHGAELLQERILSLSAEIFSHHYWHISLSIGIVTHIGTSKSAATLLDEADKNMYATKKAKRLENA